MTTIASILEQVPTVAAEWAEERADRQQRTKADPADYARLAEIGVPLMAVPTDLGGTWETIEQSARPICSMLRKLAVGDPSITLASAHAPFGAVVLASAHRTRTLHCRLGQAAQRGV